ncbi:hypothetical protein Metlim_1523 [Methanoplanus limicola DSM 2279]|uniref:Uncharacterized protein n=1 Tax=Methanoplanus limicola DSM 2279 TaxID=937775 RepID=H1Z3M5_9EURY|nr:hypothetical protein Metlim_1523 [Methanoplanus limicola DSM 2279]
MKTISQLHRQIDQLVKESGKEIFQYVFITDPDGSIKQEDQGNYDRAVDEGTSVIILPDNHRYQRS